jgi:RNA polymerase sigma factor (sigma-70 family)
MLKRAADSQAPDSLASPGTAGDRAAWGDQELLDAYARRRDEEAFAHIAGRHGGMVFRTCLRLVSNSHDAEDAAQAVFLLLARYPHKATGSLAGWLYKVARDTAITLLRSRARRARKEETAAMQKTTSNPAPDELRQELDHAISGLPTRLREAVIVCHLEGRRQDEAARMLGCNQGTLSRRVNDGLDRLRAILQRRGVVVTPAVLAGFMAGNQVQAAVPATLVGSLKMAATPAAATALSSQAAVLADATLKAGLVAKCKLAAGVVLATAVLGGSIAVATWPTKAEQAVLVNFDGATLPVNQAGTQYPRYHTSADPNDGGVFEASLDSTQAVAGNCLKMRLVAGRIKIQFEPENGKHRTFAREQAADAAQWRFNHYNRLQFWVRTPTSSPAHKTNGDANMNVGTYARRVRDPNLYVLDDGRGGFGHKINVPALGQWTQVIVNAHPHMAYGNGATDPGVMLHPTGEADYNFFDALTRIYIEVMEAPAAYPADYFLDEVVFYREPIAENDEQVYGITATHLPAQNRVIVTWSRRMDEDQVRHEVRYAFRSIHETGWDKAEPAPNGKIAPPGKQIRNGMVYDTTALSLAGHTTLYIAIKPENATRFSQVAIPLTLK